MVERRLEPRVLCADLIDVEWTDKSGHLRKALANLEDISLSGVCLQLDMPLPTGTMLRIEHPKTLLEGSVRYCVYRETGYFIGVRFEPGYTWNKKRFRPKHMLDPRQLVMRTIKRTGRTETGS